MNPSGLCPDCEDGNHEMPPDFVHHCGVKELLALHKSIVAQYSEVLKYRKSGKEPICHCHDRNCAHVQDAKAYPELYEKLPGRRRWVVR